MCSTNGGYFKKSTHLGHRIYIEESLPNQLRVNLSSPHEGDCHSSSVGSDEGDFYSCFVDSETKASVKGSDLWSYQSRILQKALGF